MGEGRGGGEDCDLAAYMRKALTALALLAALILLPFPGLAASSPLSSLSIVAPKKLLADPVGRSAVNDALALLQRGFPGTRVLLNDRRAAVLLVLPDVTATPPREAPSPASDSYRWSSRRQNGRIVVEASARTSRGAGNALYGLLQERLGYRFLHPRQTIFPRHVAWPLPPRFRWEATPRFAVRGFHLHTLHPVELTEQLHDPSRPGALADIGEYVDWLARNGQNTLQFFLLRDVDRELWPDHARAFVAYAHRRGVRVGVEISLAMLQQQAFQAVKLLRPGHRSQIDRTLAWLFRAPWDFITLESTMGEHLPRLGDALPSLRDHLAREVTGRYGARLMHATHVIRDGGEEDGRNPVADTLPAGCGILIHTVMCYSASEEKAPVYGNRNQRFMLERAARENRRRETWYWPESGYWVAFDNSVPLLLLPYLDVRFADMATMEELGVAGHITFTTGWEWGYWLTDWSIARWSWRHSLDGRERADGPLSVLADLFPDRRLQALWSEALALQNRFLKEKELLRHLSALAPFSEFPPPFDKPFQPEPPFSSRWLLTGASDEEAALIIAGAVTGLEQFAREMERLTEAIGRETERFADAGGEGASEVRGIGLELVRGLRVTALRSRHRALTMRALVAMRETPGRWQKPSPASMHLLTRAAAVREEALRLVREQEQRYRYPTGFVARKRPDRTAYGFGYLYPVSDLFFWRREEEQVRRRRFDAFFMKLWNFRRTLGLESLIF